ncbi:hypothetical protein C8F01DRAFT_1248890 [Mycena amicta]|nr:hypothetical protein C8F01DRAFT_1248890 [Mycena amicta]
MTAVAPAAPGVQTPADPSPGSQPLSWEGDKMFNIYIYDYCYKRGFRKTARELLTEAEIPPESTPPINARQGLLFEWWSVFWVLFTAKANGNGTEDAMLYTQHQAHLAAMRNRQSQGAGMMPQAGRPVNGVGRGFPPNGVMPNGIPPTGQPPGPTAFAGPNGIIQPPMSQPPFNPRGSISGPPRPPNGGGPFPSPTMAHSPPNNGQPPQGQPQPPMGALHRGSMLPPGMGPGPGQPTSLAPYQPNMSGRPPTPGRTSTPQPGMMNHSPSMAPRQPPMPMGSDMRQAEMVINNELQAIPQQLIHLIKNDIGLGDKSIPSLTLGEKQRIIQTHRSRTQKPPPNAAAGPSMPLRRTKRNSTSPGEDLTQQDDGSSPPNAKKMRRSPDQPPPMPTGYSQQQNHHPQGGGPPGPGGGQGGGMPIGNGMMRPMSGPMGNGFTQGMGPPMSGGPMAMLGGMMPAGMSPQMHPHSAMMYRQGMHPSLSQQRLPMNAGSPGSDPSFNPGGMPMPPGGPPGQFAPGPNRLPGPAGSKPMGMLPPPSPAKDQNALNKDANKPGSSPRNQPLAGGSNQPGTGPPTPQGGGNMAPSPGLMINPNTGNPVGMPLPPGSGPGPSEPLFSNEFMQNMASSLDDVDFMFRQDSDINFERDFGQWFNSADDVTGMDLVKQ